MAQQAINTATQLSTPTTTTGEGGKIPVLNGDGSLQSVGGVVQVKESFVSTFISGSSSFTLDDTIPQISEGVEITTLNFTPKVATNRLVLEGVAYVGESTNTAIDGGVGIFKDGAANAIAFGHEYWASNEIQSAGEIHVHHSFVPGSIAQITFSLRAGLATGTVQVNGGGGARKFGGVLRSGLRVWEIGV
jgi:hypothetical protein